MAELFGFSANVKKIIVLFGCILVNLTLGSRYVMVNFCTYIISYLRKRTTDTTARNVDFIWLFTVGFPGRSGGTTLGGVLERNLGARIAVTIGAIIYVSSIVFCCLAVKHSLLVFLLVFAGYGSFGMMICYAVTVQTAIKWLKNRPAFATGLVLMGAGAGGIIFNPIITLFINPENIVPNKTIAESTDRYFVDDALLDRVPWCFVLIGAMFAIMISIGIPCLFPPPKDDVKSSDESLEVSVKAADECTEMSQHSMNGLPTVHEESPLLTYGSQEEEDPLVEEAKPVPTVLEVIKHLLKSRSFYILWVCDLTIQLSVIFVITMNKAYGQTFIDDDQYLALVGSVGAIFNCFMRPFWGFVLDRLGFKTTMRIMSFGVSLTIGTFVLTEHLHKAFFMIWTASLYGTYAGFTTVSPSVLSRLFGAENMAVNFGLTMTADGLAGIIDGFVGPIIKESLGWHNTFYLYAGTAFVPFLTTFVFNGKDKDGRPI